MASLTALLLLGLHSAAASSVYPYPDGDIAEGTIGSDRSWTRYNEESPDPSAVLSATDFQPAWIQDSHDHHIIIEDGQKYDCHLGSSTWRTSWSKNKQTWCCMSHPEFCGTMHLPFNCNEGLSHWKASWPEAKKQWCCRNFAMGCTSEQQYDCNEGFWNWQAGWTADKKSFCCKNENKGCEAVEETPVHQCAGHEEQYDDCPEQKRCVLCEPKDCLFSSWSSWTEAQGCLGIASRHRHIEVENNECGLPCFGTKIESQPVEQRPDCLLMKQDCVFSTWNQWSVCQNQVDQSVRSRHVDTESLNGGEACKGSTKETRPCGGPEPKPCLYSDWHHWTDCTSSCGAGYQSRMRRVASEDHLSGQTCDDALAETRQCSDQPCPAKDCKLSQWSAWSPCTRSSLQKTRRREVLTPPEGVGMPCNISLVEAGRCAPIVGEDCITSEWSAWSPCDKSCHGGQSHRQRRIMHFNFHGGQCPVQSLQEVKACNTEPCNGETKNCQWNAWTAWGNCSHQHGTGQAKRTRSFIAATGDGEACTGSTSELKACVVKAEEVRDCVWGNWSGWTECSASCGGGSKRRNRAVVQAPNAGGKACAPETKEVVMPCNTQLCGDCRDGKWGEWSDWGSCSAKCGKAITTRHRSVVVLPNSCGILPEGLKQEFKLCDLPLFAEDSDCRMTLWSDWSGCSSECNGIRQRVRRVASFAQGNGKSCGNESLTEVADCNPMPGFAAPAACGPVKVMKDCALTEWSEWGSCSTSCGEGQQVRNRKVLQPSANGGKLCSGNLSIVRGCQIQSCPVQEAKDCKWSSWLEWGTCASCSGQRTRHRVIEQLPTFGGAICDPKNAMQMSNCSSLCDETRFCAWLDWNGECSKSCSSRTSIRHRGMKLLSKVEDSTPFFTGNKSSSCSGIQHDVRDCPLSDECKDICEPVHCEFAEWSEWSKPSCLGLCERQRVIKEMNNKCGNPCSGGLHETKTCESPCNPPVDCELSIWSEWSQCANATLGGLVGGQRYRERKVKTAPKDGGLACYGDMEQTKACKGELPEACKFGSWESWSDCSTTCGEGYRSRLRAVSNLAESGGAQCNGLLSQVVGCHAGYWKDCGLGKTQDCELGEWTEWSDCSVTMQRERQRHFNQPARLGGLPCLGPMHEIETCQPKAVDCEVSDWTAWDDCDKTCGAAQARRERAITRFPLHGGALCPTDLKQMKACSVPNCDVKDCQVSGWLEWGECSTSCGQGHQSRARSVLNLREPGGYGCFFSVAENRVCHNPECSQDCEWHDWQTWGECSMSCGGGSMSRLRKIKALPSAGGKHCEQKDMQEVKACNVGVCHDSCINGLWAMWQEWSPCSSSCGGGVSSRHREVKRMANSCGNPAIGDDKETKFCNVDTPCTASKDCLYTGWSSWSECSASCLGITMRRRNIASYGRGDSGLFCQGALEEVTGCNSLGGTSECGEGTAIDCEMNTWSEWSDCTTSCDGGEMRRHRSITKHAQFGGATCSGHMEEVKECARARCAGGGVPIDCVYGEWKEWGACLKCSGERKRFRHILVYPAQGGRECAPADVEEVGSCPNPCAEEKFCSWNTWSQWGACSMSCGPGGKRKRSRGMVSAMKPMEPSKHVHLQRRELIEKYHRLYARSRSLEDGQMKEIFFAFSAGFFVLFAAGSLVRRVRRDPTEADVRDTEAQVSDSERPFLPANL